MREAIVILSRSSWMDCSFSWSFTQLWNVQKARPGNELDSSHAQHGTNLLRDHRTEEEGEQRRGEEKDQKRQPSHDSSSRRAAFCSIPLDDRAQSNPPKFPDQES